MGKIIGFKDRSADSSVYPITLTEAVYTSDGRTLLEYIDSSLNIDVSKNANGSVIIQKGGETKALFTSDYIFNVCAYNNTTSYSSQSAARIAVPTSFRRGGLLITYYLENSMWYLDQYTASSVADWDTSSKWTSLQVTLDKVDSSISYLYKNAAMQNGSYSELSVGNLVSWKARGEKEVVDEWSDPIRTTAGSLSINSEKKAYVLLVQPKDAFSADSLISSGENLLNPNETVDGAYVFMIPKLQKGSYGTADEANGVLFVDKNGNNLKPTVRFSSTYPTSATAGSVITPYQFDSTHAEWFYPSSGYGYFIVSGLSVAAKDVCARIGWSKNYDKYVAYSAPSEVGFTSAINAIVSTHSSVTNKMLACGNVCDEIVFSGTTASWSRRVSAIKPTWTTTADADASTYTHTATIPTTNGTMKTDGSAEDLDGNVTLTVLGTTVSYTDSSSTSNVIVKYELASVATGRVTQSNEYQPNDFGIEALKNYSGNFLIRTTYYQGVPDTVYLAVDKVEVSEGDIDAIDVDNCGDIHAKSIDMDELPKVCGYEMYIKGSGAPTAAPDFIGQEYLDLTNKKLYKAFGIESKNDFVALN